MPLATLGAAALVSLLATPPQFVEETVFTGLTGPVGLQFGPGELVYVWEKRGALWVYDKGDKTLVLDLIDETNEFWTRGLTDVTLHPDFQSNGYVYLSYTVDWEHYITDGNPDPAKLDLPHDTFGRISRITLDEATNFTTVVEGSRWDMIGATHEDGFAVTFASHTQNSIVFAPDGSMLVSAGDGAGMLGIDVGGFRDVCCSSNTAEADGILREKEQIGAFRSQLVDTHSGKILRVDPDTADGLPDNPFFDPADPSAPRSRVWTLGLRNPYAFAVRPGTGGEGGDPGVLFIGDVGWDRWERLCVATALGQNMGWPKFEGNLLAQSYPFQPIENLDAPNPLGCDDVFEFNDLLVQETLNEPSWPNPCDPGQQIPGEFTFENTRAVLTWRNARIFNTPLTLIPAFNERGEAIEIPIDDSPVDGPNLKGVATVGGEFYTGDKFPPEYDGAYFFAEAGGNGNLGWIMASTFHDDHTPEAIWEFRDAAFIAPTGMTFDPDGYALYYADHQVGNGAGAIRRIVIDCNDNGLGDDLDIALGLSADRNDNGIPDECETCPADFNGDGQINVLDFVAFQLAWVAQDPAADCDLNAEFNVLDFVCFQQLFVAGCG